MTEPQTALDGQLADELLEAVWTCREQGQATPEEVITEASAKIGEKIQVARFARFQLGEGS